MRTFCPNCEKDTECEFTAELYECKECGEDFAKYIVSRKALDEKTQEDALFAQLKIEQYKEQQIKTLQLANEGLRNELSKLKHKSLQQEQFIWWAAQVYARNVNDLVYAIMASTTYDTEGEAKEGKWALPRHIFELMDRIDEYTEKFYDGSYLDVEISTDAKKGIPENKPAYNENANSLLRSAWMIANRNGEQTNWEAFKNAVYKELVVEHNAKTSSDNNKPSPSDVSVTQDVLTSIKTGQSVEKETCSWIQEDDPDICYWKTGCGNSFYFTEGTPTDNNMKYCCYCGKLLKQEE